MDRASCIRFIEDTYFGNVAAGRIDGIMQCFTEGASVIIRHGDHPERLFGVQPTAAETPLRDFYAHLCGNYDAWFGDFEHYIDTEDHRAASRFTVRLTPKPGGLYADAGTQELFNCNFFEFRGDAISHMIIYYSNPNARAEASATPTGYPNNP
jgi:hypothetical protein